jgi:predicted ester cyclase
LGTHFRGIATPTGQTVDVELVHIFRIRDGMITEHWAVRDDVAMFQQLGGLPNSAMAPPSDRARPS